MSTGSQMASPSVVVAQALNGQLFEPPGIRLELRENLFRGHPRPVDEAIPSLAVFVLLRGGEPLRRLNRDTPMLTSLVSVYVRGPSQRHEYGEDFARSAWFYLHNVWRNQPPAGYYDADVTDSEPEFVGYDDFGHSQWTLNLRLIREE